MLNPIATITVESALIPSTSEPEVAADLFQTLIAELLEPTQAPDTPPAPQSPLLGKGGEYASPQRDAAETISEGVGVGCVVHVRSSAI